MSSFKYNAMDIVNKYNKHVIDNRTVANDYKFYPITINDDDDDLSIYKKIKNIESMLFDSYKLCGVSFFSDIYHEVVRIIKYYQVIEYEHTNDPNHNTKHTSIINPYEELLRINLFIYQLVKKYHIGYDEACNLATKRLKIKIPKEYLIKKLSEKEEYAYNEFVFKIKSKIDPLL